MLRYLILIAWLGLSVAIYLVHRHFYKPSPMVTIRLVGFTQWMEAMRHCGAAIENFAEAWRYAEEVMRKQNQRKRRGLHEGDS